MSTTAASDPEPQGRAPFADGSPAQVRAALIPEDVAPFDRQWLEGMAKATEHLDLTEVLGVAPRRLADHSQSTRRLPQNARPGRPYVAHR